MLSEEEKRGLEDFACILTHKRFHSFYRAQVQVLKHCVHFKQTNKQIKERGRKKKKKDISWDILFCACYRIFNVVKEAYLLKHSTSFEIYTVTRSYSVPVFIMYFSFQPAHR